VSLIGLLAVSTAFEHVHERKGGAGHFFFGRSSQPADDSFASVVFLRRGRPSTNGAGAASRAARARPAAVVSSADVVTISSAPTLVFPIREKPAISRGKWREQIGGRHWRFAKTLRRKIAGKPV